MDYRVIYNNSPEESLLQEINDIIREKISVQGFLTMALSGGNTPEKFYRMFSKTDIPFDKIHFFLVDERYLPSDHEESNFRMINSSLFKNIEIPGANVYKVDTDMSYDETVSKYENEIEDFLETKKLASFDIVILGLGEDGHTASVFSENREDFFKSEKIFGSESKKYPHRRITMSINFINKAKHIFFLIKGEKKRGALKRLVYGDYRIAAARIVNRAKIFTDIDI
jgi:6-phosphogluconolactonase